mmetsp:Transcript_43107/g.125470  ORF Transcript_43107/g.125470 Transcript_43107/m.125470 type:complete len:246 (-) Transcript_43107:839-1576(-)
MATQPPAAGPQNRFQADCPRRAMRRPAPRCHARKVRQNPPMLPTAPWNMPWVHSSTPVSGHNLAAPLASRVQSSEHLPVPRRAPSSRWAHPRATVAAAITPPDPRVAQMFDRLPGAHFSRHPARRGPRSVAWQRRPVRRAPWMQLCVGCYQRATSPWTRRRWPEEAGRGPRRSLRWISRGLGPSDDTGRGPGGRAGRHPSRCRRLAEVPRGMRIAGGQSAAWVHRHRIRADFAHVPPAPSSTSRS